MILFILFPCLGGDTASLAAGDLSRTWLFLICLWVSYPASNRPACVELKTNRPTWWRAQAAAQVGHVAAIIHTRSDLQHNDAKQTWRGVYLVLTETFPMHQPTESASSVSLFSRGEDESAYLVSDAVSSSSEAVITWHWGQAWCSSGRTRQSSGWGRLRAGLPLSLLAFSSAVSRARKQYSQAVTETTGEQIVAETQALLKFS